MPELSGVDNNCLEEPVENTVHLQDTCDMQYEHHRRRRDLETSAIRNDPAELLETGGL